MPRIDSDAHVIENERTWEYMEGSDAQYKPITVVPRDENGTGRSYWLIDGNLIPRGGNEGEEMSRESREMADIQARLRHMDELEVDVQVLFPSLFLRPLVKRPEAEVAICRSYNRWMADIWSKSNDRLRWASILPLMSMEESIAEARFARDHGGCAFYTRGIFEERLLTDSYFDPIYEVASDLDMPMCVHAATPSWHWNETFEDEIGFAKFKLPAVSTFHSIIATGLMQRFPKLRYGFIEVSAQWVPYALHDLARRFEKRGKSLSPDVMREQRLYVACQVDDDIPYVLKYAGEDNLVIGSDYGHADTATELEALAQLRLSGEVSATAINKILDDNARALYGL
jgi:predicted TIM-barrel fold metal-dependent hydrolase